MTTEVVEPRTILQLSRPPVNKEELWWTVYALWGVKLPRVKVCPDHVSPFDAFAEAYFGNWANWVLWYGSRGTGKSYMLAILAMTKAALLEINVTLLGGSMAQSNNIHEHVESLLLFTRAPVNAISNQIKTELGMYAGNWIRPLPASQKTVRGPHPQLTLLDEIDEMDRPIYDAAMGQAMEKPNQRGHSVSEMVVASSTWQNPVGTFQSVKDEAEERGLPVRTWCYKEVLAPNGWMSPKFIERKKLSVPKEMFRVEYELGEPAGGSRAFDLEALNKAFVDLEILDKRIRDSDSWWLFEEHDWRGTYAVGVDWAKEKDRTVIAVLRTDTTPRRTVYLRRINRHPWPMMIDAFNKIVERYAAVSAHDATGLGNVINDMIDERTMKFVFNGASKPRLINEYVVAVENGVYQLPRNTPAYVQHKATTVEDIYASARYDAHLPDDVAAFALAHRAAERMGPGSGPGPVATDPTPSKVYGDLQTTPESLWQRAGDVVSESEKQDYDPFSF